MKRTIAFPSVVTTTLGGRCFSKICRSQSIKEKITEVVYTDISAFSAILTTRDGNGTLKPKVSFLVRTATQKKSKAENLITNNNCLWFDGFSNFNVTFTYGTDSSLNNTKLEFPLWDAIESVFDCFNGTSDISFDNERYFLSYF
jgi:hypothetical protein